jgi:phosphohistidine phosphatase
MRIYLMRHASAADPGGTPDALRPLTEQGRREAREAGEALRDREAGIAIVLSSPRLRARETAELVVEGLGRPLNVEVRETLSCGATGQVYLDEIRSQSAGQLLLVAHNPELSAFASALVGQAISFRPSTVCAIDMEADCARLDWVRHPS